MTNEWKESRLFKHERHVFFNTKGKKTLKPKSRTLAGDTSKYPKQREGQGCSHTDSFHSQTELLVLVFVRIQYRKS